MNRKKPRILICPLDWGLGHATRCIPVIRQITEAGGEPVIAADGPQLRLLQLEFPDAGFVNFRGYSVRYSKRIPAAIHLMLDAPRLLFTVYNEHRELKKLVRSHNIDAVISDNRYGLWHKKIYSVLITHQVNILPPPGFGILRPLLRRFVRHFIRRFDACWIPDLESEPNLSGDLSHGKELPANTRYIGLLSRFDHPAAIDQPAAVYDLLAIVSGPEPQRSIFEEKLIKNLPHQKRCLLLRGIPGDQEIRPIRKNLDAAMHLPAGKLEPLLRSGPVVVCRAGYSTLMDIAITGNKAILIPTPGQTEQEYLAANLDRQGIYTACRQSRFDLGDAYEKAVRLTGLTLNSDRNLTKIAVKELIDKLST